MVTPAERAQAKQHHRRGRRHHEDPRKVARNRVEEQLRAGGWRGPVYGVSAYGIGSLNNTNPPVSGPGPADAQSPGGHLNPEQFVGYPGGYSTDGGNYTGVQAIEGAAGNGGAGGDAGASGGAPS